jgi:hypothetical protein
MTNYIMMRAPAGMVGSTNSNLRAKKEGMKTVMAPVLTTKGIRLTRFVPADHARRLIELQQQAKANTEEVV